MSNWIKSLMNFKNKAMRIFKNRAEKIQYLKDVRDGKRVVQEVNYSAMTDEELEKIISICQRLRISEASPENLIRAGATLEEREFFEDIAKRYS